MHTPWSLDRVRRTIPLLFACLSLPIFMTSADAQSVSRIVAARETLTIRSCAEASCRVVAELPRGQSVEVLKTEAGWHWVLVMLDGARATTGWVDSATTTAAPRSVPTFSAPAGERQVLPPRGDARAADGTATSADCLACAATRAGTPDEWSEALALTSGMKGRPAASAPPDLAPARAPAGPNAPRVTGTRADAVRRDGRSTLERMRDEVESQFGEELTRLAEVAEKIDPDLQTYLAVCYQKYLPIVVIPPGPTPPYAPVPPVRVHATIFDLWHGRPVYAWNETWSTRTMIGAESTAFCEGLWNDVNGRSEEVKAGVERVELAARVADIYPGVVRDALQAYGLGDKR